MYWLVYNVWYSFLIPILFAGLHALCVTHIELLSKAIFEVFLMGILTRR